MSNLLDIYELIDISSSSEEEGEIERASTPLPRDSQVNPRIIIEIPHSSAEATADDEEYLDLSLDSLETDCKRMKLSDPYTSFESVESGEYPHSTDSEEAPADSPESPDEQEKGEDNSSLNSGVFVVEGHYTHSSETVTSTNVADYLEHVTREDASSFFVTPPGPLRRVNLWPISPLNDLEEKRTAATSSKRNNNYEQFQHQRFQFGQPGRAFRPMTVALSQSAPGLVCGCRRVGYGRGHGCTAKLANRYFRY